jgi:hypothetical protein
MVRRVQKKWIREEGIYAFLGRVFAVAGFKNKP